MILVQWTSASKEEAEKIIKVLLEKHLIACAHLLPVESHYVWQEKYHKDQEIKSSAKTTQNRVDQVFQTIQELSSYEVCEILAFDVVSAAAPYLCWVEEMCGDAVLSLENFQKIYQESKKPFLLLDVRTKEEYDQCHLKKAKLFDFSEESLNDLLAWRKKNPGGPICLVCGKGRRSLLGRHQLRAMGFEQVYSIEKGTEGCIAFGMTVVSNTKNQ